MTKGNQTTIQLCKCLHYFYILTQCDRHIGICTHVSQFQIVLATDSLHHQIAII